MNADVEKAVDTVTSHIADLNRCIGVFHAYPQMKTTAAEFAKATKELEPVVKALRDQESKIERLQSRLREEENNATESARRTLAQRARAGQAEALLRVCDAVARRRGDKYGLCDAIDNDGQPYQSASLAAHLQGAGDDIHN